MGFKKLQKFNQLFIDQPIQKDQLMLTVPEEVLRKGTKTHLEILTRYTRNGIALVLDDYYPDEELPAERILELGISRVRIASEKYMTRECEDVISDLRKKGITVIGKNADSPETLSWLNSCSVFCSSGTMTGIPVNEDEMILDSLAREQA